VECENGIVCQSESLGLASNPTSSAQEDGWLSCETQEVGYLINHPRLQKQSKANKSQQETKTSI
jgi:hypothetical protein